MSKPFKVLLSVSVALILVVFLLFGYVLHDILDTPGPEDKQEIASPLSGVDIDFAPKKIVVADEGGITGNVVSDIDNKVDNTIHVDDIVVTTDFVSYLLNEIGAWKLQSHPLTRSKPVLNVYVGNTAFHAVVEDSVITSYEGSSEDSDVTLSSERDVIIDAILSEDPGRVFVNSFGEGKSSLSLDASETTLFAKGYIVLYESLGY